MSSPKNKPILIIAWSIFLLSYFKTTTPYSGEHEISGTQVEDDELQNNLLVSHYICAKPENTEMYSIVNVPSCELEPEKLEVNDGEIQIFQKNFLRYIPAYKCQLEYDFRRWHCGWNGYSTNDAKYATMTKKFHLSPQQCHEAAKKGETTITIWRTPIKVKFNM